MASKNENPFTEDDEDALDDAEGLSDDEKVARREDRRLFKEARDRFREAYDYESPFRKLFVADVKFANADSDNGWQWPDSIRQDRETNQRPALTINKVAQHVALVTNDARQNKPSISVRPMNREASFKAAEVFEGIFRFIEYKSGAQAVYDDANDYQVEGGIAYWLVDHDYLDEKSFDQDVVIKPVRDQMNVLLDCYITLRDGSDANWGFIFDEVPNAEFKRQYPDAQKAMASNSTGVGDTDDWIREDCTRVAMYYRLLKKNDTLYHMTDENGVDATFLKSELGGKSKWTDAHLKTARDAGRLKERKVTTKQLQRFKIAGSVVLDKTDLPGKYIPIVRVVGKERVIEGKLERKGLVRALKDPQRMYNYNSSGQVEFGALATKSPWIGAAAAFAGNEPAWNTANTTNKAYLTYKHIDEDGNPIPPPTRPEPPGTSPAFLSGMEIAARELEMASGQYQAKFGDNTNEKSGKAINARQRQADVMTYHYVDNLALAVRYTGKIVLDMIPHYYDTERVIQIMGLDGTQSTVLVKPDADEAVQEQKDKDQVAVIFNPNVGKYDVEVDIGPAYATQRQEAWNAFVQIVTGAPELINEIGDLMFQSADFPLADKIAERLKRKIRQQAPWLFDDDAATPAMQQLKQQLEEQTQTVGDLLQKLAEMRLKLVGKDERRDIQAHEADTKRITALTNAMPDLENQAKTKAELVQLIQQVLGGMSQDEDLSDKIDTHQEGNEPTGEAEQGAPPVSGARLAPDGHHYLSDPNRPGKYLRVHPRAPNAEVDTGTGA